jgi:hypothetical protein
MKNPWSQRNLFVKDYIDDNISIIDFGCGNKEILDFCHPSRYLGIDVVDTADLHVDLNLDFKLDEKFDVGLLLGVLEYLKDPNFTLSNIKKIADKFIILSLIVKKKPEWQQAFTETSIDSLLRNHFKKVTHFRHDSYILSVGEA